MSEPWVSDYFALNVFLTTPRAVKMGAEGAQWGETIYRSFLLAPRASSGSGGHSATRRRIWKSLTMKIINDFFTSNRHS